ncbi:MAG TPA: GDP-mannose 4,6-dehydratase [Bacteroidales bacterium]|nr:GDP-mannose 4,6-dehydratase [Bacteroidales bacterium]
MKRALITGINGQDGSYLAELLLEKEYEVHGIVRPSSYENINKLENVQHFIKKIKFHPFSLEDNLALNKVMRTIQPDECYHFAAQSYVDYSFGSDSTIMSTNFNPTLNLLNSIVELCPDCKFYFSGSSEMFGNPSSSPQDEQTPFNPRSLYGISKLASHFLVNNFRETYGLYACTGIAYNHESPRRGYQFVTRKITSGLAKICAGTTHKINLGNIDAVRDWGYAPDYVRAMWMMLNNPSGPKNYVIATGVPHSVREFLKIAFETVDMSYENYIVIDKDLFRPAEKVPLVGDSSRIKKELGWDHTRSFREIVEEMVFHDIERLREKIH